MKNMYLIVFSICIFGEWVQWQRDRGTLVRQSRQILLYTSRRIGKVLIQVSTGACPRTKRREKKKGNGETKKRGREEGDRLPSRKIYLFTLFFFFYISFTAEDQCPYPPPLLLIDATFTILAHSTPLAHGMIASVATGAQVLHAMNMNKANIERYPALANTSSSHVKN